jgi:hypothetical protein
VARLWYFLSLDWGVLLCSQTLSFSS